MMKSKKKYELSLPLYNQTCAKNCNRYRMANLGYTFVFLLRELHSHDYFQAISISFRRPALYKDI